MSAAISVLAVIFWLGVVWPLHIFYFCSSVYHLYQWMLFRKQMMLLHGLCNICFYWLCNICFNYSFLSENFVWHCVHLQWHVLLCPPGIAVVELIRQVRKLNLHRNTDPKVLVHLILAERVKKLIF